MGIGLSIKNPYPDFKPGKPAELAIIRRMMKAAGGVYSSWRFDYVIAMARRDGRIKRRPSPASVRVLEAITQCACYYWDIVADKVTITAHKMAIDTGTATESAAGNFSVSRVDRHLRLMDRLGLVKLTRTSYRGDLGCYEPVNFTFTPLFFDLIDIPAAAIEKARNSRVALENKKRRQIGEPILTAVELAAERVKKWIARFAEIVLSRKRQGELRHQRRLDLERKRSDIYRIEYQAALARVNAGTFSPRSTAEFRAEVEQRTNRRMTTRKLHTRLSTV